MMFLEYCIQFLALFKSVDEAFRKISRIPDCATKLANSFS